MNTPTSFPLNTTLPTAEAVSQESLKRIGLLSSLLYFGIPAVVTFAGFHIFRPWLEGQGYDSLTSYLASLCVPVALLFAAALIGYHKVEGRPLQWKAFTERMRYGRMTGKQWLAALLVFLGGFIGYGMLSQVSRLLVNAGLIPLPGNLPALADPNVVFTIQTLEQAAGGVIRGRWDIVILYLVTFFFNIVGEELWWRGYILPRQELAFGRWTWLVHGVLWAAFHVFKWWDVLSLLPICLLIAFASQRLNNNWPALIAHALMNGIGMALIILVIAS